MNANLRRMVACLGLLLSACSSSTSMELDAGQEILFHVSYENNAGVYQNDGWFIDREGNVWGMSPALMWNAEVAQLLQGGSAVLTYPAADLEAEYRAAQDSLLLRLAPDELEEMSRLVRATAAGTYSAPEATANDAGLLLSGALLYDPETDTYRRIVLSIVGDWTVVNESASARQLVSWLMNLNKRIAAR